MNGWSWLMLHNFLNHLRQATTSLSDPPAPVPFAKWPQPDTSSNQPRFMAWLCLGISNTSTSSSQLKLLCSSGRVALGKTQEGAWPVPPGKPQSLCTQRTAIDYVGALPPCPCTADAPQRVEDGGQWSQPVLEADWPGYIPPIDLPTVIKVQIQEEGVFNPHEKYTLNTQIGC